MSRLTGKDAFGLIEAYNAVHTPQVSEEQIWEEVETWVNSLVEEGYDLSEYTWEEMYEEYLNEMGQTRSTGQNSSVFTVKTTPGAGSASGQGGRRGSGSNPSAPRPTSARPTAAPTQSRFAGARDAAFARARQIQGSPVVGSRPSGGTPAPAARPSGGTPAPAARPSAAAPAARPAAAKPAPSAAAPADKDSAMKTWAKANPSLAAKVKPGQSGYGAIQQARAATGGEAAAKAAEKLDTGKITGAAFSGSTPALAKPLSSSAATASTTKSVDTVTPAQAKIAASPKPTPMGSKKPGSMLEEVDVDTFDLVLEYLISEGFADTNEAALAIMANMSEEWREEIVEGSYEDRIADNDRKYDRARKRAAQRAKARNEARARGENVGSPRPERTSYTDSAGVQRHHSGAKMP